MPVAARHGEGPFKLRLPPHDQERRRNTLLVGRVALALLGLATRTCSSHRKLRCTARNGATSGARRNFRASRAIPRYVASPERPGACSSATSPCGRFPIAMAAAATRRRSPCASESPLALDARIRFPRRPPAWPCARAKSSGRARTRFGELASKRTDRSLFFALPVTTTR